MAYIFSKLFQTDSTYEKVEGFIQDELVIRLYPYDSEANVEDRIQKQLAKAFGKANVDTQHYLGGNSGLKCDVDLFNGGCGIEIKLAEQLENMNNAQRALGQVLYYTNYYAKENLMLLVVGRDAELSPRLKELKAVIHAPSFRHGCEIPRYAHYAKRNSELPFP